MGEVELIYFFREEEKEEEHPFGVNLILLRNTKDNKKNKKMEAN